MLHVLGDGVFREVVNTDESKEPAGDVCLVRVEVWVVPEVFWHAIFLTHGCSN